LRVKPLAQRSRYLASPPELREKIIDTMSAKRPGRSGILSLSIKDKTVLYAAYMPFVKGGGLFIPTKKEYAQGDEVFMLLNLMDEVEKIPVAGKSGVGYVKGCPGKPGCRCWCALQRSRDRRQESRLSWSKESGHSDRRKCSPTRGV